MLNYVEMKLISKTAATFSVFQQSTDKQYFEKRRIMQTVHSLVPSEIFRLKKQILKCYSSFTVKKRQREYFGAAAAFT